MKTVAIVSRKGGVGKTTLTHHLAGALVEKGRRVLLVDYDPQASLTRGLIGDAEADALVEDSTVWAIQAGRGPDPRDLAKPLPCGGLYLVPGSEALAEFDLASPYADGVQRLGLRHFLAEADQELQCDFCLIDCPPALQVLTASAVAAAEYMLTPVLPDTYSVRALKTLDDFVGQVRAHDNELLSCGILLNRMASGGKHTHSIVAGFVRKQRGADVFRSSLPLSVVYEKAIAGRVFVTEDDPKGKAAEAIRAVADELVDRLGRDLP